MIKVNTKQVLKDFEGKELNNGGKPLTVGVAISMVLGGQVSNPTLGWILGKKFATEKEVELKAEDVVFIKKELEASKVWLALVTGQIIEILDGDNLTKKEKAV